jgi:hypothetical protein
MGAKCAFPSSARPKAEQLAGVGISTSTAKRNEELGSTGSATLACNGKRSGKTLRDPASKRHFVAELATLILASSKKVYTRHAEARMDRFESQTKAALSALGPEPRKRAYVMPAHKTPPFFRVFHLRDRARKICAHKTMVLCANPAYLKA